jgi:hypothetical protein
MRAEAAAAVAVWRASWHSLRICSLTIMMMSRVAPSLSLANSSIFICSIGNVVWAPFQPESSSLLISG